MASNGFRLLVVDGERKSSEQIKSSFEKEGYNSSDWLWNEAEETQEKSVYYLKRALEPGKESALLFDGMSIDPSIMDLYQVSYSGDGKKAEASFAYDDLGASLSVEVQAVQESSGDAAQKSAWGVPNVSIENGEVILD